MATLTLDTRQTSLLDGGDGARAAPAAPAVPAAKPREARPAAAPPAPTLDELVSRTWSSLRVSRAAACLLCGGEVAPRYGSGPHPVGGACRSCGTEIG
jgi:hypothetical protein